VLTNQSGPSRQICLTFSNAKVSVNLAILHQLTINCHPVTCIYDGIRQILSLIIPILGNICKRVANFRHKFVSCSRLLVCVVCVGFISQPQCVFSLNMKQKPTLKFQNAFALAKKNSTQTICTS